MKRRIVKKFRSPEAMAAYAAGVFAKALRAKKGGPLLAALPGGKTPLPLFRKLASLGLPWEKALFFMSDERLVPSSSRQSNFGTARRLFFSKAAIPRSSLRPISPAGAAAAAYEKELLKATRGRGRLDLVFLGLGGDGHTASLFPGSPVLSSSQLVSAALAPRGVRPRRRVTLTLRALNKAGAVVLMASGRAKEKIFSRAASGDKNIPAGRLAPRGDLYLLFSKRS